MTEAIVATPPGYDNVGAILGELAGRLPFRQLDDQQLARLSEPGFLDGVRHLFVNCRAGLVLPPSTLSALRSFVESGGTLYASDWASDLLASVFGELLEFSRKDGSAETVHATVSDPALARRIGNPVPITFDMSSWVLVTKFPATAEVYLTDIATHKPLAIGFRVGSGRVVFTSFHHHAQQFSAQSAAENELVAWLVALPIRHQLMITTGRSLNHHRTTNAKQMMANAGREPLTMPVEPGRGSGLGVFSLSWDYVEDVEFSLRYLRDRERTAAHKQSSESPVVITVRNPSARDSIEVVRHAERTGQAAESAQPFVLGTGLRRDLLGDPDWFAAAVIRRLQCEGGAFEQPITPETGNGAGLEIVVERILSGLGYLVERRPRWDVPCAELRAWTTNRSASAPDLLAETFVHRVSFNRDRPADEESSIIEKLRSYPGSGETIPGTEGLLIVVAFLQGQVDAVSEGWLPEASPSSVEGYTWLMVATDGANLDRRQNTISVAEHVEQSRVRVAVYRIEENAAAR